MQQCVHQISKIFGCGFYLCSGLDISYSKYHLQHCLIYSAEDAFRFKFVVCNFVFLSNENNEWLKEIGCRSVLNIFLWYCDVLMYWYRMTGPVFLLMYGRLVSHFTCCWFMPCLIFIVTYWKSYALCMIVLWHIQRLCVWFWLWLIKINVVVLDLLWSCNGYSMSTEPPRLCGWVWERPWLHFSTSPPIHHLLLTELVIVLLNKPFLDKITRTHSTFSDKVSYLEVSIVGYLVLFQEGWV